MLLRQKGKNYMITILLITFIILLFLGVPLFICMGFSSLLAIIISQEIPIVIVIQRMFANLNSFTFLAIPLFILAGQLMCSGGITKRLIKLADCFVGHIRGGLSHINVVASIFFAGISGSAMADVASIGSILIPSMLEEGYDGDWAASITAASAAIGVIIPPSILMIIYGIMTDLSIGKLFLGGIIPGLLIGLSQIITGYILAIKRGKKPTRKITTIKEMVNTIKIGWAPLLTPLIILGGITSGVFTATEAGAIAAAYVFILSIIYKQLTLKSFFNVLYNTAKSTTIVMLIIACAGAFGAVITLGQVPDKITKLILSISSDPNIILILIIISLVISGFFITATTAIIIYIPYLMPIADYYGFDPYHFAILVIITTIIGGITPPVGGLLYLACSIGNISVKKAFGLALIFAISMLAVVFLLAFVPTIVTFLPDTFMR